MDGYSAVLLDEHADRLDEKGRHYLERIRKAASRMAHLIDGLLDLARLTRRELSRRPSTSRRSRTRVAADLRALEPERDVQVAVADGMTAEGDPRLLHVVLENLIGNALKFTSTRPDAVVEVGCAERDGETVFFVRDNGVGFDMAYAGKLFDSVPAPSRDRTSSRGPGSASRRCSGSSPGTADGSGPSRLRAPARPSPSRSDPAHAPLGQRRDEPNPDRRRHRGEPLPDGDHPRGERLRGDVGDERSGGPRVGAGGPPRPRRRGHPHAGHGRLRALPALEGGRAAPVDPLRLLHGDVHGRPGRGLRPRPRGRAVPGEAPGEPTRFWPGRSRGDRAAARGGPDLAAPDRSTDEKAILQQYNEVLFRKLERKVAQLETEVAARDRAEREVRSLNSELEERVRQRTVELESANRELEAFSYSVAHDLRAPLRAIDGYSALLESARSDALDEECREHLARIRANVLTMSTLIDAAPRVLAHRTNRASKGPARHGRAGRGPFSLSSWRPRTDSGSTSASGSCRRPTETPRSSARSSTNLLSNALKFSSGKEQPVIEVGSRDDEGRVFWFVRDNGAGFDMRFADKLFGVFQRLHDPTEFPGVGVGLAIVQRIVARHGGTVRAEGRVGEGAEFSFSL